MDFKNYLAALIIFGALVCTQGDFTSEFNLKKIPKGLTMIDVIESLTQSPKYLASSDQKKLKMLDNLIFIVEELTKVQNSEKEKHVAFNKEYFD